MQKQKRIFIGIDPDIDKSGVAVWDRISETLELSVLKFFDLHKFLSSIEDKGIVMIVVEAGWLNRKNNFRQGYVKDGKFVRFNKFQGESIANKVGRNAETGRKIVEMCESLGLEYKLFKPTQKKVTPDMFQRLTGKSVKNQEMIDAAIMVIGY